MSNKKPIKKVNIKLKNELSASEKLQKKNTNLTVNESIRKVKDKAFSNENLFGNNLSHMVF